MQRGGAGEWPTRRTVLRGGGAVALLGAGTLFGARVLEQGAAFLPLHATTVAFDGPVARREVTPAEFDLVVPGSRVLREAPDVDGLLARERGWLDSAAAWTRSGPHADLARSALLDLHVLTAGLPATVAGWSPPWRYVWPRDTAHVAAALAVAGHLTPAVQALRVLQRVPRRADGWFEARYRIEGDGPPDDRAPQLDGVGWALWAIDRVLREVPVQQRVPVARTVAPLAAACLAVTLREIDTASGLPRPSPDYWEVDEARTTLGTAAPLAAGLDSAARVFAILGDERRRREAVAGAGRLRGSIRAGFGPSGYPRELGGRERDAAVAFLLPPYAPATDDALVAFRAAQQELRRPAGGLAPGAGWKRDGISWTPETALFALAAAGAGEAARATALLDWVAAHRTAGGSLPEKVLQDGRPAAVAPLAWTAALVLLAAAELGVRRSAGS
ncbi:hypothetical protein FB554_2788 [Barrientosiimonas humi]|uniref:GH15 family glucan-1,4-alpha-glucosidase n=1 Tax=Barrientosiimonas humi TaxID=999931 RepID=A0A542XFK9_9MICO|nr:glycoside hydrolase family 15 [Barrientosiimonas humi]TQL34612.1 hypothetical protein FB554_2788 [Barrientosiimonas humi]CAG7574602.1 hypothetical protein BH39T_PBIAJDOK_03258 [Barrientosiimonas humi]